MIDFYYLAAGIAYALFALQTLGSFIFGSFDFDVDIDFDGIDDFSMSDLVSFKGLLHFAMGLSGFLAYKHYLGYVISPFDWIIGIVCGFILVIVLYFIYRLVLKLNTTREVLTGEALVGRVGTVLFSTDEGFTVRFYNNGEYQNLECFSAVVGDTFSPSQTVTIIKYQDGKYFIQ